MHGFWNFFDINFDRLHVSKHTDQCVRINSPEDFWKRPCSFFFIAFQSFSFFCRRYRYYTKRPSQLSATLGVMHSFWSWFTFCFWQVFQGRENSDWLAACWICRGLIFFCCTNTPYRFVIKVPRTGFVVAFVWDRTRSELVEKWQN